MVNNETPIKIIFPNIATENLQVMFLLVKFHKQYLRVSHTLEMKASEVLLPSAITCQLNQTDDLSLCEQVF